MGGREGEGKGRGKREVEREGGIHTTIPILTFSPPAFSSTASSRTTFRKTCTISLLLAHHCPAVVYSPAPVHSAMNSEMSERGKMTYIIPSQHPNDFPAAVQLHEESLVEILDQRIHVSRFCVCGASLATEWATYLLELGLSLRHRVRGAIRLL